MDIKHSTRANLKKYIKVAGKRRLVPVLKANGIPVAGIVLVNGAPLRSTSGAFYLGSARMVGPSSVPSAIPRARPAPERSNAPVDRIEGDVRQASSEGVEPKEYHGRTFCFSSLRLKMPDAEAYQQSLRWPERKCCR